MSLYELRPIVPASCNNKAIGYKTEGQPVIGDRVQDLPLFSDGDSLYSVWEVQTLKQRLRILFSGKVTLRVLGQKQPPVVLIAGDETR